MGACRILYTKNEYLLLFSIDIFSFLVSMKEWKRKMYVLRSATRNEINSFSQPEPDRGPKWKIAIDFLWDFRRRLLCSMRCVCMRTFTVHSVHGIYPGFPASAYRVFIDGQTTKNERYKIYVRSTKIQWMDKLAVNHFWKLLVECIEQVCISSLVLNECVCVYVWGCLVVCRILVDLSLASMCTSKRNWKKQTKQNERIKNTTFCPEANTFGIGICGRIVYLSTIFPHPPCIVDIELETKETFKCTKIWRKSLFHFLIIINYTYPYTYI